MAKVARVFRVCRFSNFKAESRADGHFIIRQIDPPTPKTSRDESEFPFLNFRVQNSLDPAYFWQSFLRISELTLRSKKVGHSGARNYY